MKRPTATVERLKDGSVLITIDDETHMLDASGVEIPAEVVRDYIAEKLQLAERKRRDRLFRSLEAIDTWASLRKSSAREGQQAEPPRLAEAAFAWLAPKATVDSQLGDLQEIFADNVQRHGWRRARWLYWLEVMRAIAPAAYRLAKRIGFIGLIIDYCRAKFGL